MMGKPKNEDVRNQVQFVCLDELVPQDHLLRKIDAVIDFNFLRQLVRPLYADDTGRPSLDPVMLLKLPMIQYLYGKRSMRQTIKEIQVNVAYRWFLGLDLTDNVPHFTTFGKNFERRFKGTDLFQQIFEQILNQCFEAGLVDPSVLFIDGTHIKAAANNKKYRKQTINKVATYYHDDLEKEITTDRLHHGKKELTPGKEAPKQVEQKISQNDPDSGWFHKGEHKQVFAYSVQTACEKHGWILDYTINAGNQHDSQAFEAIYRKVKHYDPLAIAMDSGYKTPAIAHEVLQDGTKPIFPYKRPMTKPGFFKKHAYVYDEHYDCYICPNDQILSYSTTNREGYREYKSSPKVCRTCAMIQQCTLSKNHQKVITRHIWQDALDECEDIRHTLKWRAWYDLRKETIERIFGTAKEDHGLRYTNMRGREKMAMKVGLTFACMNMKKLAKLRAK
nr:IS1182 family transposase [Secundilactobacillus kimchicus]